MEIWSMTTGECLLSLLNGYSEVVSLATLGNNVLASGGYDDQIKLWDLFGGGGVIRTMNDTFSFYKPFLLF